MPPIIEQDLSHVSDAEINRQLLEAILHLNLGLSFSTNDPLNFTSDRTLTRDIVENAIAAAYNDDFGLILNRTDLTGKRFLVLHEKRTLKPLNRVPLNPSAENRAYAELALLRLMSLAEEHTAD